MTPTILAIDTAGPVVGAALLCGDELKSWSKRIVRGADSVLTPAIAELLAGGVELHAVAVSVGPGGFTSLRVGVAHALGVAVARGVPVVPVSSLEARAAALAHPRTLALLDGRKGRAYVGFFTPELVGSELDVPPDEAIALADGDWVATGEGAHVWAQDILDAGGRLADDPTASPAAALARLGRDRFPDAVPAVSVRLRYLRAPDAKLPKVRHSR